MKAAGVFLALPRELRARNNMTDDISKKATDANPLRLFSAKVTT